MPAPRIPPVGSQIRGEGASQGAVGVLERSAMVMAELGFRVVCMWGTTTDYRGGRGRGVDQWWVAVRRGRRLDRGRRAGPEGWLVERRRGLLGGGG
jgi:hypothetical protein